MHVILGRPKLDQLVETAFAAMDGENEEGAFVGACMLICEVRLAGDNSETAFYTFCTDKRQWVQNAIINEAETASAFNGVEFSDGE